MTNATPPRKYNSLFSPNIGRLSPAMCAAMKLAGFLYTSTIKVKYLQREGLVLGHVMQNRP
jgi:hypothetical protein